MIRKNPAAIKLDEAQVEKLVDLVINFIKNLRPNIINSVMQMRSDPSKICQTWSTADFNREYAHRVKTRDVAAEYSVGKLNAMSMRQAILSVRYPFLDGATYNKTYFNNVPINIGATQATIKTKNKEFTVEIEIRLEPEKAKKAKRGYERVGKRNLFEAGAEALSPIGGAKLKEFLQGKPLEKSIITLNVASEVKYKEAIEDITYKAKTTRQNLRDIIVHEMTHVVDPLVAYDNLEGSSYYSRRGDWTTYFNILTEVKARIAEFTALIKAHPDDYASFDDFYNKSIKTEISWRYLNEKNKKYTLAAVYSEWIKVKEKKAPLTPFQKRKAELQSPKLNIFRYLGAALDGVYAPKITAPEITDYKPIAAQVVDRPQDIVKRTRKPTEQAEFTRKFKDEYSVGKSGADSIQLTNTLNTLVYQYKNRKYFTEIRTAQEPLVSGGFEDWDGDYDVERGPKLGSAKMAKMLETIYWPIGYKRVVSVCYEGAHGDTEYVKGFSFVRIE